MKIFISAQNKLLFIKVLTLGTYLIFSDLILYQCNIKKRDDKKYEYMQYT